MARKSTTNLTTTSSNQTEAVARIIGNNLKGGEVLELAGDLGSGKTTFVRGLAAAIGSSDRVASPSFTLSHKYEGQRLTIDHYDFYRLNHPGVVAHELSESLAQPGIVSVIEWGEIVSGVLPAQRLTIKFSHSNVNERLLELSTTADLAYLMKGLEKRAGHND
jgi:tRNA threonylcarbamoyladenosine biosynthesis protein TsaE